VVKAGVEVDKAMTGEVEVGIEQAKRYVDSSSKADVNTVKTAGSLTTPPQVRQRRVSPEPDQSKHQRS